MTDVQNQHAAVVTEKQGSLLEHSSDVVSTYSSPAENLLERKLLLKLDLHVMPILIFLFLISFVDRTNIGNAKIQGMEKSLHMNPKGHGFSIALSAFNVSLVLFEIPSNIILKKVQPALMLSGIMFCWG